MSDTVIRVDRLAKEYRIGAPKASYRTLREHIAVGLGGLLRRRGRSRVSRESVWALKDISFEVHRGEVLGIIGPNGAGKSTLLKILSRITEPTKGYAELRGRVGCLLEVGTGFHPELTGRENIYLSGAILGMRNLEITQKLDEIVAFAEVERFLDTPVKRYSSGMYLRLAFAVAAHLEPDILIIDEVLAVGDLNFQRKCLGKMDEIGRGGRTALFVSHSMPAVENLCPRAVLLNAGQVVLQGDSKEVINSYLQSVLPASINDASLAERTDRTGNGTIRLTRFHIEDLRGAKLTAVSSGQDVVFVLGFRCEGTNTPRDVDVGFSIHSGYDRVLVALYSSYVGQTFLTVPASGEFRCHVERLPLAPGRYPVGARVTAAGDEADWPRNAVGYLDVVPGDFYGTGRMGFRSAPFMISGHWELQESCVIH